MAALAIYTSLAGKTSVKESEAPGTATKTFLNSPQEQSPPLQPSPTPQVSQKQADLEGARRIASPQPEPLTPQEQPASAKPTGTETVPVPQQDIQSEGTEWSPSISYQVTTKDHGLSKIIAFHYHNNKETGFTTVILANFQITRENLIFAKQTLLLPKLNKNNNIIKLNDN